MWRDVGDFCEAYIECALWSETDDNEEPLDKNYIRQDIEYDTLQKMIEDCNEFELENEASLDGLCPSKCGHDFWLTRNGHGAGFWDREKLTNEQRDLLTEGSKKFGAFNLYAENGVIYGD